MSSLRESAEVLFLGCCTIVFFLQLIVCVAAELAEKSCSGSRIVDLLSTRGSLAIVVDCLHLWRSLEKVWMLGSAAESAWIVSWKDQSFSSCRIHVSFRNLVCVL